MLLMGGAGWEQSVAGDAPDSKTTFQASDSGTDVPPPRP